MTRNIVDVLKGTGIGVAMDGRTPVRYELLVSQEPDGSRKIEGWILPTFGMFGETVVLEMQDGTNVRFSYTGQDGNAVAHGGVFKREASG